MILSKDREVLKELLMNYPVKEIMQEFSDIALEAAGDASDIGFKDAAKDLVKFSMALDDLIAGRPFLV